MKTLPSGFYSMRFMFAALKNAGISCSNPNTYLKYEKMGIFLKPKGEIVYRNRIERIFTADEIDKNVRRYVSWKKTTRQKP